MAMKVGELFTEVDVRDGKFNKGIGKMQGALSSKLGVSSAAVGAATAGIAAVGAAAAAAGAKGVKEFSKFEKGMKEVFTLVPNASEEMKNKMQSDIRAFSQEMGVATDEAVPALYQAISAGVPKENVFEFLKTSQKAAVGGVTDLKTAVDGMTSVVNAYGEEAISAEKAGDLMFTAVKQGKTTFEEMSSSLSNVIPTASAVGVKFEDVSAAIASMTAQGTPTKKATTQIRQALNELSKEGSAASDAFEKIAGQSFTKFIDQGGNMQEAMALMQKAAEENNTSVKNLFSSVEAGQAALALTGQGAEKFKENLEEMDNSAGATEKAYNEMEKSLSRSFDKMKAAMHDVWLEIGKQLAPAIEDLTNFITENMPIIKSVTKVAFKVIGLAIQGIVFPIDKTMDALRGLFDFLDMIKDVLTAPFKEAKEWLESFSLKNIGESIVQGAVDGIRSMANKPVEAIKSIFGNAKQVAKNILGIASPSKEFEKIGINTTEGFAKGLENSKKSAVGRVSDMMSGVVDVNQPQIAGTNGGPQVIRMTINQNISDRQTAEYANDDLVSKLQGRGLAGAYR